MQISSKFAEPKNVGKANETSACTQADLEASSLHKFKLDRKYKSSIEECKKQKMSPMLAMSKDFSETKKYVTYPADIQPKLDGNRCLVYWQGDRVVLLSRGGKEWNLPHIEAQVRNILPEDAVLDGELYIHGESCQRMTKLIKSKDQKERETVQLHVYDVPVWGGEELPWSIRRLNLQDLPYTTHIRKVRTFDVNSENEIYFNHNHFVDNGYEGAMVRCRDSEYLWGYRSNGLLKVKSFNDSEYVITDFSDGKGKNVGVVKWKCQLKDGREFDCAPSGSKEDREQMFKEGHLHIGKLLKVKHWGFTDDGFPRFPIGIGFRENNE